MYINNYRLELGITFGKYDIKNNHWTIVSLNEKKIA